MFVGTSDGDEHESQPSTASHERRPTFTIPIPEVKPPVDHDCTNSYFFPVQHRTPRDAMQDSSSGSSGSYQPDTEYHDPPVQVPHAHRRMAHLTKLSGRNAPPYIIPEYEQACFKYIFREAFDAGIDVEELQALGTLIGSMVVNIVVVSLNVFQTDAATESDVLTTQIAAQVVFIAEFSIVIGMTLCALMVIVEVLFTKQVSTDTAVDFVDLTSLVGTFSVFQVVNVVSPTVVINRILPLYTQARGPLGYLRAGVTTIIWLMLCLLACLAVVLKVSQVGFTGTVHITDWTTAQFLKMFGLFLNLAKVDKSYDAELSTLLKSLHQHYYGPGGPDSLDRKSEGWYSRLMDFLDIDRSNTYEYFEAVFNHHFGEEDPEDLTFRERCRKAINFGAFISKLNTSFLARYLQMIQSPLPPYASQREEFHHYRIEAHNNLEGMEAVIKQADPEGDDIADMAFFDPHLFRLTYACKDDDEDEEDTLRLRSSIVMALPPNLNRTMSPRKAQSSPKPEVTPRRGSSDAKPPPPAQRPVPRPRNGAAHVEATRDPHMPPPE